MRFSELLTWRATMLSVPLAAEHLGCDALSYKDVPPHLYRALVDFRHLRFVDREIIVARFLRRA